MKRETYLWTLIVLGLLHSYLSASVFGALLSLSIFMYLYYSRMSFNPDIRSSLLVKRISLEEGKVGSVKISLENRGSPVYVNFKYQRIRLERGEKRIVTIPVLGKEKGIFDIDVDATVEDIFGIYEEKLKVGTITLEVLPSIDSIRKAAMEDYNIRLKEKYKKSLIGSLSLEIGGLREYYPGDDVRRIDWKASARLQKLIVREFLKEADADVYIVLDQSREMRKGKVDYASTLALYLATLLIRRGYKVGLIRYWESGFRKIDPGKGGAQLDKIRKELKFRRERGLLSTRLGVSRLGEKAIRFLKKVYPKGRGIREALLEIKTPSYIILISDLMTQTPLLYSLILMVRKKHKIIIVSPNPILFYRGELNKDTLLKLYERYVMREKNLKKFSSLVPVVDVGPSDYVKEVLRGLQ
ncbi:DUF58 domain-containing protein [Pyrococcus abyssi]|uniref:DUF58 domain-containing protein n=1 Tax=Pyrococcus abyssi (strain GE5 / Orsay) TaxID=272844 RepID=Q9UYA7_PYRAB|nr:DUF58 domain-containing protein [Pyrococcus abyssi]CAB50505.1 Hypothetical protein PAB1297 [Pyrococcus abyssi GE5]CCE71060.1 TPA: hypothetical protein PAB1297 [Pyrococcus abyssi GE5]